MVGWDLEMYINGHTPYAEGSSELVAPDTLRVLGGNAWSAFSYMPLIISTLGSVRLRDEWRGVNYQPEVAAHESVDTSDDEKAGSPGRDIE